MLRVAVLVALAGVLLVPDMLGAQAESPSEMPLQIERRQRRAIVRPSTPAAIIERDADAAAADADQRRRDQDIARDLGRAMPRRPDLDYDVKSGIQSQRLNDALRHR